MMRTQDPVILWDLLSKHVSRTQSYMAKFAIEQYKTIIEGFVTDKPSLLRHAARDLHNEKSILLKYRRQELLALRKAPMDIALGSMLASMPRNSIFMCCVVCSIQLRNTLIITSHL